VRAWRMVSSSMLVLVPVRGGYRAGGAGRTCRSGSFRRGGEVVDGFAGPVPADQLLVGQTIRRFCPAVACRGWTSTTWRRWRANVLDALDAADDAEAPPGTRPLSAARRRRSLAETVKVPRRRLTPTSALLECPRAHVWTIWRDQDWTSAASPAGGRAAQGPTRPSPSASPSMAASNGSADAVR